MNIQIFGKSKCFDTKKAERYFKERRVKFQGVDVVKFGMSRGELSSVRSAVGLEAMIVNAARSAPPSSATESRPPWATGPRCGRPGSNNERMCGIWPIQAIRFCAAH